MQGQRLVETQPRRQQRVVAVDVWRTPVVRKRPIQSLGFFRVDPPEGLARHPVQEVIPLLRFRTRRRREFSWIVGSAELIKARISRAALNIVKGSHRRSVPTRSESNLRNTQGDSVELWNQAGWILRKRRADGGHHHRLHV